MEAHPSHLLVVDDDPIALAYIKTVFENEPRTVVHTIEDPRKLDEMLAAAPMSVVLLDLNMPHISGMDALKKIRTDYPELPVIVVTAEDSIETAVECMQLGANNFMTKPIEPNRVKVAVRNALQLVGLKREVEELSHHLLERNLENPDAFTEIITSSDAMKDVFRYVEAISGSDKSVLITGESGTGKELLARSLHRVSCPDDPFVAVNVAGLDDTMFSDTLFGHARGAYTGAQTSREGLALKAERGILFLDEIGDLPQASQTKLLRIIQECEFYPLGIDEPKRFEARVVAATNVDLEQRVEEGTFRQDLYYRLLTHTIRIPPLRERREDIPLLAEHFNKEASASLNIGHTALSREVINRLVTFEYPGNIRELQSLIYDAVSRSQASGITVESLERKSDSKTSSLRPHQEVSWDSIVGCFGRFPTLREAEECLIEIAMKQSGGNQSSAAELLGVSQSTMSRRYRNS